MIVVFLANGFEEVEAIATIDLLRRAELEVKTAAVGIGTIVNGSHGMQIIADMPADKVDLSKVEMVVLPGGMPGTLNLEKSPYVQKAVAHCAEEGKYLAAICAAPSILGHKGLLKGKKATCFPGFEQELFGAEVTKNSVEVDDKIITAKGMGVTIDFALQLVELLEGPQVAQKLRLSIQFPRP